MNTVDINITAGREQVQQPWIWQLSREFNVKVNIRQANIDLDFASVLLTLEGPIEDIHRATAWLMTTGLHVEAEQRAVGA